MRQFQDLKLAHYSLPGINAFQRFRAPVGRINVVGFDRLNPQLQERVIPTHIKPHKPHGKPWRYDQGRPAPDGARNRSGRPFDK